jgi:hypothetical protein
VRNKIKTQSLSPVSYTVLVVSRSQQTDLPPGDENNLTA